VPTLATDEGTLTEVPVLLSYIAHAFPKAGLAPPAGFKFFEMQSFNTYLTSSIHITYAHIFRPERYADSDAAKAEIRAKAPKVLREQLQLIEDRFADGREWVHGSQFTISDPYLYVFARWLERDGVGGAEGLPGLIAHRTRMQAREAVKKTLEQEGLKPL
jgi:glutathione S-transferase